MNKRLRVNGTAEGGFTLIELIVVIVILGILAATALPKFAGLGGDARFAALQAAKGSLTTVVNMAHGRYIIDPTKTSIPFDGTNVALANGYPGVADAAAATAIATAMGLDTTNDYTLVPPSTSAGNPATSPATGANEFAIVPKSIAGKTQASTCFLKYGQAASGGTPTITLTGTTCE